jgi:1-aminocyclopropane-1-carboxylate deaminase
MEPISPGNITVDDINLPQLVEKNISAAVLRLDKIHPLLPGNKWFKLKNYLEEARAGNKKNIVTFGGAYSNHILATAAACHGQGFSSTGIIRGEEPAQWSPTLQQAAALGMELIFISREDYGVRNIPAHIFENENNYLVPEGGYGKKGADGASLILDFAGDHFFTHIACAVGTTTTMAGLVKAAQAGQTVTGISVMKNNDGLENEMKALLSQEESRKPFSISHEYHFGGYAKHTQALLDFMNDLYRQTSIPTDFVYTGKLFYAILDLISRNYFPPGSSILLIHSGGLQGNLSLAPGRLIF